MKVPFGSARLHKWARQFAAGGMLFGAFSGCDANVQDTLVGGLQSTAVGLATTLIDALFETFATGGSDGGLTTVKVIVEEAVRYLA